MNQQVTVDFWTVAGALRRELHSSGLGGLLIGGNSNKLADLKPLNFTAARTHDWALVNPGERMLDTHFIFPLAHADADDPKNYFFGPSDEILAQTTQELGLKVMYRMGTSIESVNARRNWQDPDAPKPGYYNCVEPSDWQQYTKVLSHIIRHYTEGWNNGFKWGDKMVWWELWNEPNDRPGGSWLNADGDFDKARNFARFRDFFVYVLKALKAEFPHLKFGGPAVCYPDYSFLRDLLAVCKEAGYTPDFISWHNYGCRPGDMLQTPAKMRALCDEFGFTDTELVINEWHYLPHPEVWGDFNGGPATYARLTDPINGLTGIESGIYTLQTIAGLQETCLGQSYWYGCSPANGALWGIRLADGSYNKQYYATKLFGTIIESCDRRAAVEDWDMWNPVQAYGYFAKDAKRKFVLVSRYKGGPLVFDVCLKGLGEAKCVSCLALDRFRDLEEVLDTEAIAAAAAENESRTPFSPSVASPVFKRNGDVFTFKVWDPASVAYLLVFE